MTNMTTNDNPPPSKDSEFRISSIFKALCPACHQGRVTEGVFGMRKRCPHCNHNLYPEPGFYLGAMVVGFLFTAIVTIPPTILLKVLNVDEEILIVFPFLEFVFVGTFLMF